MIVQGRRALVQQGTAAIVHQRSEQKTKIETSRIKIKTRIRTKTKIRSQSHVTRTRAVTKTRKIVKGKKRKKTRRRKNPKVQQVKRILQQMKRYLFMFYSDCLELCLLVTFLYPINRR